MNRGSFVLFLKASSISLLVCHVRGMASILQCHTSLLQLGHELPTVVQLECVVTATKELAANPYTGQGHIGLLLLQG